MERLFGNNGKRGDNDSDKSDRDQWLTRILGFVGSAIVCWVVLNLVAPLLPASISEWTNKLWVKAVITTVVALALTAWLSRIEGTIWARYYVIIGYLLSLALVVWIALRIFHVF
jgi:CBS domain containing-hemolysin-like protein